MIAAWILILFYAGPDVEEIEGFTSKATCVEAGDSLNDHVFSLRYECLEVK
jgi:hypothetical protein